MCDLAVNFSPFFEVQAVADLHTDAAKLLLILVSGLFADQFLVFQVFFQAKKDLVGFNRLNEIIGDARSDCLLHDTFLFAFGDHHHGQGWEHGFDPQQGLNPGKAGHLFIKKDNVECIFPDHLDGFMPVVHGRHLISFFFQE